jgi:hypothetical protein
MSDNSLKINLKKSIIFRKPSLNGGNMWVNVISPMLSTLERIPNPTAG